MRAGASWKKRDEMRLMAKPKDRHVMEALGKTRVVVENGKVVEVGEPQTEYCPIFAITQCGKEMLLEGIRIFRKFYCRGGSKREGAGYYGNLD
ncbi:methanogenesis marker protein 8 [groundwater metagenome]